jgi:hypothetical protein
MTSSESHDTCVHVLVVLMLGFYFVTLLPVESQISRVSIWCTFIVMCVDVYCRVIGVKKILLIEFNCNNLFYLFLFN